MIVKSRVAGELKISVDDWTKEDTKNLAEILKGGAMRKALAALENTANEMAQMNHSNMDLTTVEGVAVAAKRQATVLGMKLMLEMLNELAIEEEEIEDND